MQEIRCKNCESLLAKYDGKNYTIISRRADINVSFTNGVILCKCGTMFIAEYFKETTIAA